MEEILVWVAGWQTHVNIDSWFVKPAGQTGAPKSPSKQTLSQTTQMPRFARQSRTAPTAWKIKFGNQTIRCGAYSG